MNRRGILVLPPLPSVVPAPLLLLLALAVLVLAPRFASFRAAPPACPSRSEPVQLRAARVAPASGADRVRRERHRQLVIAAQEAILEGVSVRRYVRIMVRVAQRRHLKLCPMELMVAYDEGAQELAAAGLLSSCPAFRGCPGTSRR